MSSPAPASPKPPLPALTPGVVGEKLALAAQPGPKPVARPARMKRRHWGLFLSFVFVVLTPVVLIGLYLSERAQDQYASTVAFTVRQEDAGAPGDMLGGLISFAGASVSRDSDVLYAFIQSQQMVETVAGRTDLVGHYTQHWQVDPLFSLWPSASVEDLLWYWQRVVRMSYDQSTGLIEVQVLAFDPDFAQRIAQEIVVESQDMINALNVAARNDAMAYARADLEEAVTRLKSAREALTQFRSRTQIVDPEADIQGRMGVLNNLQQQLAESLIELDLLRETTSATDPRVTQATRRIDVIRERIAQERENFATANGSDPLGEDYPALISEYESLVVDREFAERTYTSALSALDTARSNAMRQSRYLASYIRPTQAQEARFPQSGMILGLTAIIALLFWAMGALIFYSLRDRR